MGNNIKDVASLAGVSPSTVSRVVANHPRISQETRERVRAAMKELDYHPNAIARSLVKKTSDTIGLLIPSPIDQFFLNPFFTECLRGITSVTQQAGYDVLLSTANFTGFNDETRLQHMLGSKRVDGVILLSSKIHDPLIPILEENHVPSVLIGRPAVSSSISWVNNDNQKAAYDATTYLLQQGHHRIGFLGGSQDLVVSVDRLAGYHAALRDASITLESNLIVSAEFLEEGGYTGMMRLMALAERPTAIVASDDVLGFGAMRAAGELGYRIPEDLAIVGFNDIPLAKMANPPMTSMNVHIDELGKVAAEVIIEQISQPSRGKRTVIIQHDLVIRRSCSSAAPPYFGSVITS